MSALDKASRLALRRLIRYLRGSPRLVYSCPWQPESALDIFVDTDFAGCLATRPSTSGGVALRGAHLIKHWSCTQRAVTLGSAEAEFYGLVKATTEALGIQAWGRDLGLELAVRMHADSEAAIGICRRSGIGRVRYLAVGQLWVQEGLRRGDFAMCKVRGNQNPADVFTKSVPREVLDRHLRTLGLAHADGRAASAPRTQHEHCDESDPAAERVHDHASREVVELGAERQEQLHDLVVLAPLGVARVERE